MSKVAAYSTFGDYVTEPTVALAERLAGIAPVPGSKVFFTSGGSDSVDTAAKLARRYWNEVGQPSRRFILGRQKAYHGMHYAGTVAGRHPRQPRGLRRAGRPTPRPSSGTTPPTCARRSSGSARRTWPPSSASR